MFRKRLHAIENCASFSKLEFIPSLSAFYFLANCSFKLNFVRRALNAIRNMFKAAGYIFHCNETHRAFFSHCIAAPPVNFSFYAIIVFRSRFLWKKERLKVWWFIHKVASIWVERFELLKDGREIEICCTKWHSFTSCNECRWKSK